MIILEQDAPSRRADVLCPTCGRISRQALVVPCIGSRAAVALQAPHTCPVCGAAWTTCTLPRRNEWKDAYKLYQLNPEGYDACAAELYNCARTGAPIEDEAARLLHALRELDHQPSKQEAYKAAFSDLALLLTRRRAGATLEAIAQKRAEPSREPDSAPAESESLPENPSMDDDILLDCAEDGPVYYPEADVPAPEDWDFAPDFRGDDSPAPVLDEGDIELDFSEDALELPPEADVPAPEGGDFEPGFEGDDSLFPVLDDGDFELDFSDDNLFLLPEPDGLTPGPSMDDGEFELDFSEGNPFEAPEPEPVSPGTPAQPLEALTPEQRMDRRIDRWKKELLDTGKRNRMINYRETLRGTLRILEPGAEALFNLLAVSEKELTFQRPVSKSSDFRTYSMLTLLETLKCPLSAQTGDIRAEGALLERERTLRNLRSKSRLAQEEQGTNILYLSFGFILWKQHERAGAQWVKSPVLLMPVTLGLKSLNAPFTLSKFDEEIEVNPTLAYLFSQEYGVTLPPFDLKNRKSFSEYMDALEELVNRQGWRLLREVSLGLLSFLKISMYHDLNENYARIVAHPVLQAIAGNPDAVPELPAEAVDYPFDKSDPSLWHEVVDADSSQEEAILLSKLGVSFVMQGPPGTGKSQTITNIIAEALGEGKKVLFVSEKAAALQVVLKRLTEAHLDDFCLSLHNWKANKRQIVDAIGANLDLEGESVDRAVLGDLAELFQDRQYLNAYAEELHQIIEPLGESAYQVFGRLSALEGVDAPAFALEGVAGISAAQFARLLYSVQGFEKALRAMEGGLEANPWAWTSATSSGQVFQREFDERCAALPQSLRVLDRLIGTFNKRYAVDFEPTWNGLRRAAAQAETVLALPLFPYEWLNGAYRAALRARAEEEKARAEAARERSRALTLLVEDIGAEWQPEKLTISPSALYKSFARDAEWPGVSEFEDLREANQAMTSRLTDLLDEISALRKAHTQASSLLSLPGTDTLKDIDRSSELLALAVNGRPLDPVWFEASTHSSRVALVEKARSVYESILSNRALIEASWDREALSADPYGSMLERFENTYTGFFYWLRPSYVADMRLLRRFRNAAPMREEDARALLRTLKTLRDQTQWFTDNENDLRKILGSAYTGMDSDWKAILELMNAANALAGRFEKGVFPSRAASALCRCAWDRELWESARALSERLPRNAVADFRARLEDAGMEIHDRDSAYRVLVPRLRARINRLGAMRDEIAVLYAAHSSRPVTMTDALDLLISAEALENNLKDDIGRRTAARGVPREGLSDRTIAETIKAVKAALSRGVLEDSPERAQELAGLFDAHYHGPGTDWDGVIELLDSLAAFETDTLPTLPAEFVRRVCNDPAAREDAAGLLEAVQAGIRAADPGFAWFSALFPNAPMKAWALSAVAERCERCESDFLALNRWLDYIEARRECDEMGLSDFTRQITHAKTPVSDVSAAFAKGFYTLWLDAVIDRIPAVRKFRKRVHEQRLEHFAQLDERQFAQSVNRIRSRIIQDFPARGAPVKARSEEGILRHEMEKKRRLMPLRKLLHEIPNLLLTLKPCLMMSPLSVAYFLRAEDYHFDMVIFDEASQIFPQDAVGAIFRADQVIIAGDTRQLPPTNFFAVNTGGGDYDDYEDEEIYDSILEETANVLPSRMLLWHYRSRHEHLIAFSNQQIYRGSLVTFPSASENAPDTGVEFVHVPEGYYEGGGRNCNIPEAKRCVELIRAHIEKHPDRSLGVIAFSEKQQQVIAQEVQHFREQNPGYEAFFAEDRENAFFVKNLENVQGDERDTILFSVGYARTLEQKMRNRPMAMRFGPLGAQGGERRLNVAITRARVNVKLVSSILPSDIDLNRTDAEGVQMLRDYMEYALSGGAALSAGQARREPDDFALSVYDYLRARGYRLRQNVGCSGYRIDIAVMSPDRDDLFVAGIECDGPAYARARTARDRDRLRKAVLEQMGWRMVRVWSAEWIKNPEIEGRKLTQFIDAAIAAATDA